MKTMKFLQAALIPVATLLYSCNGDGTTPSEIQVDGIKLDKSEILAFVGDEIKLEAILTPADADNATIEWSSSDENIATVDSTGLVVLRMQGEASIYATCNGLYDQCDLTSVFVEVGQYYCSDGTFSDEYDPQKAIAAVFYTRQHPNDLSDYSGTGIRRQKCHGYAVALHDAIDSYCIWGPYDILECYPKDSEGNPIDNFSGNTSDTDWSGYLYTQMIYEAAQKEEGLWGNDVLNDYAACWYAMNYEQKAHAPENSSGWFLPSGSQLWEIFENIEILDRQQETALVENDWYWSSSEYCDIPWEGANFLNTQQGSIEAYDKFKGAMLVRSVIAF